VKNLAATSGPPSIASPIPMLIPLDCTNIYVKTFSWSCFLSWYYCPLKGVSHEIFRALFWHVWIDLALCKNLWMYKIFSVEPLILYLRLKFRCG
jgi:hypothetical protein